MLYLCNECKSFNWFLTAGFSPLLAVFLYALKKRVFSRFKSFFYFGGIIYQLGKENGANRIFGKNNFFGILTIKFFSICKSTS